MLRIGEFSKLSRISVRMLRYYDKLRILVPDSIDPCTGYRSYHETQLSIANRIVILRDMGFSLMEISQLLQNWENPDKLRQCLFGKRAELLEHIDEAKRRLILLDIVLERLRKDEIMQENYQENYNIQIRTIPERFVASVRKIIPDYSQEGTLWGIFCEETARMNIQDGPAPLCAAVYHDGEYKESDVDVEIQKSVAGVYPDTEHVKFKTVPAVQVVSAIFHGGYHQISAVNEAIAAWIAASDYKFDGLFFNIYHVSPYETRNPDEFVTEICYPVRKK